MSSTSAGIVRRIILALKGDKLISNEPWAAKGVHVTKKNAKEP